MELKGLCKKGWIEDGQTEFKLHQIIKQIILNIYPPNLGFYDTYISHIADIFSINQAKDNPVDKFKWVVYGESINTVFVESDHADISRLLNNLALVLQDLGDYENVLQLSDKSVTIFKNVLPKDHPNIKTVTDIYQSIKECMS